jgi:MFS family permease
MKLNYKKTFTLGFGFFAIMLCASLYDAFVPLFLSEFIEEASLIGFLMTMDNYIGLFLQPLVGSVSDRTNTRFGRRMPYILICMPLAAIAVCVIPNHWNLISLIVIIVLYNLIMSAFRSPTVALMPDITPVPLRSKANGVINFMGGVGSVIAFFIGSKLYKLNHAYPFYMAAILLVVSAVILFFKIKEKRDALEYDDIASADASVTDKKNHATAASFIGTLKAWLAALPQTVKSMKNVLILCVAIFFWFIAYNAVSSFFSLYGEKFLQIDPSVAVSKLTYFSISMLVTAIPAGWLGTLLGKRNTILIGLVMIILVFVGIFFTNDIDTIGFLFIPGGIGWALININSYPFVVSMASGNKVGSYTGLYYFFSSLAAIASPPVIGALIDRLGYGILFKYSVGGFILALIFLLFVKTPKEEPAELVQRD